jgi:hypothetical protein
MTWNYRIIQTRDELFGICEVYYSPDQTVYAYSAPVTVVGESPEDLKEILERMTKCLKKPVLIEKEIELACTTSITEQEKITE